MLVGWLVLLQGQPIAAPFTDFVNTVLRGWDRATVHAVLLTGVVLVSLFIVNTRAAYYFVLALVSPRELVPLSPATSEPADGAGRGSARPPATRCAWVRWSPRSSPAWPGPPP